MPASRARTKKTNKINKKLASLPAQEPRPVRRSTGGSTTKAILGGSERTSPILGCLRFGGRSAFAARVLPKAFAAAERSRPRASCPTGQTVALVITAARMCFGQAPIGALPSQHPALQADIRYRGARMKHFMHASTSATLKHACDLNGLKVARRGASSVTASGSAPGALASAGASSADGAAPSPNAAALVQACIALTVRCQAA